MSASTRSAKRSETFFEALTALPNGADVYHALGGDMDRLEAVLDMNPVRMGMALAEMSADLKAKSAKPPTPISRAPKPIKPIEERGAADRSLDDLINDPNASMEEIDRRLSAEETRRFNARH
jgi:hypothetical protein